ncbi:MAG: redoxin [Pirellula sp.]|nr:redoxin [Pirellula sp.]
MPLGSACRSARVRLALFSVSLLVLAVSQSQGHRDLAAKAPEEKSPEAAVRQAPKVLKPGDHGVGRQTRDTSFKDLSGRMHQLGALCRDRILVVAATGTSCPLSKKYVPSLVDLAKQFDGKNVRWLLVNATKTDEAAAMQADLARFAEFAKDDAVVYVHDEAGVLAQAVGLRTTTDVVVLDGARTVLYHGAVDDQYGLGYGKDEPKRRYLADALTSILAGRKLAIAATDAPGCALEGPSESAGKSNTSITYHNRISRIIQNNCLECHRPKGSAPFSLATYEEVDAHAPMIEQVVRGGIMPPWFAAKSAEVKHAGWANERSLAAADQADLLNWIAAKRPRGDEADAPRPVEFSDDWTIGKPDAVFGFKDPVQIPATGVMPYKNIYVDTNLPEGRWVQAIEIRPGNREVVHHVLVFVATPSDTAGDIERQESGTAGFWGIYVPGNSALVYPEGMAKVLPAGAKLRFQMHYTPNGTATTDRTEIGVIYAKKPPVHDVRVTGVANLRLNIPPRDANFRSLGVLRLPYDVEVLSFLPHMHLRGKACRYDVQTSDGTQLLLDIPRYDFNWQLNYQLAERVPLKRGDVLQFTAWYDNSEGNPANPDPSKNVRWGQQTYDEMQLGYVEYIVPGDEPGVMGPRSKTSKLAALAAQSLFHRFDTDDDGSVSREELDVALKEMPRVKENPKLVEALFERGDVDRDKKLSRAEFERLRSALAEGR